MSDHGFAPWAHQVNINSWLAGQGFMALREPVSAERTLDDLFESTAFFQNVEWEGTQAYGLGLSSIYLNLEGREGRGIVPPGRSEQRVKQEIARGLLELKHGPDAEPVVGRVVLPEREMWGLALVDAPDLVVGFNPGYRTAWQSSLGAVSPDVVFPNLGPWASDHCSTDPGRVPGLLAANRSIIKAGAGLADIGATVLAHFGLTPGEPLDGQDLFSENG